MNVKKKNIKWWIGAGACVFLFAIIGIFTYMKMNFLVRGVDISATVDKNSKSPVVSIRGSAENAIYLSLNGREIYIDKDGKFDEQVALLPGLSVMTLSAQDKFGKSSDKNIDIMYQESTGSVAVGENIININ